MTWVCIAVTVALISVSRPWGDWLQAPNGPGLSEQLQHVHMRASGVVWVSAFMFRVPLGLTSDLCVPTVTIDWRNVPHPQEWVVSSSVGPQLSLSSCSKP